MSKQLWSAGMRTEEQIHKIFDKYFVGQPAMDDLVKATYAYHTTWRQGIDVHSFTDKVVGFATETFSNEKCKWCGRSRRDVRWDSLPAQCGARPTTANQGIADVIHDEEKRMYALLDAGPEKLQSVLSQKFGGSLSSAALFHFQTSLGYEPDIVSTLLDLDIENLMPGYDELMALHKTKSGVFKRKVGNK